MKSNLAGLLSEKIEQEILKAPVDRKITAYSLAREFGVSTTTVLKSLRRLREKGLITFGRGKPIQLKQVKIRRQTDNQEPVFHPAKLHSRERLYNRIKDEILGDVLPKGQVLPKFSYLASRYRASRSTVAAVISRMQKEGLVEKKGRGYQSVTEHQPLLTEQKGPIVCILQFDDTTWIDFQKTRWGLSFLHGLLRELPQNGFQYRIINLNLKEPGKMMSQNDFDHQIKRFSNVFHQWGNLLAGVVVLFSMFQIPRPIPKNLKYTLNWLTGFSKPVFWLDKTAEIGGIHKRSHGVTQVFRKFEMAPWGKKRIIRFYPDENYAMELVLQVLEQAGHQKIGLPLYRKNVEWMTSRKRRLNAQARQNHPGLNLVEVRPFITISLNLMVKHLLESLSESVPEKYSRVIQTLMQKYSPTDYVSDLSEPDREILTMTAIVLPYLVAGCTSLIVPNDRIAHRIYRWSEFTGLSVPEDVSLVSFDDDFEIQFPFPISSVNFGFEQLGRVVPKIIQGQIKPALGKDRGMPGECFFNHLMSIGMVEPEFN